MFTRYDFVKHLRAHVVEKISNKFKLFKFRQINYQPFDTIIISQICFWNILLILLEFNVSEIVNN